MADFGPREWIGIEMQFDDSPFVTDWDHQSTFRLQSPQQNRYTNDRYFIFPGLKKVIWPMANTESASDFNRLQAELFHRQTTSTSRKRRNKPSTPTTVTTKTTIMVSLPVLLELVYRATLPFTLTSKFLSFSLF